MAVALGAKTPTFQLGEVKVPTDKVGEPTNVYPEGNGSFTTTL